MSIQIESAAIIISINKFGESALILDCFTREHGVVRGLLKSLKAASGLAPGVLVHIVHKVRIEGQLGVFKLESVKNYTSMFLFDRLKLQLLNCVLVLLKRVLFEGDKHALLYERLCDFLEYMSLCGDSEVVELLKQYALLELEILKEAGYGLDLSCCVATGHVGELVYISPKSGCAVSKEAGLPYHSKLFEMPKFYLHMGTPSTMEEVMNALKINEFFLQQRLFPYATLPHERLQMLKVA